VHGELDLVGGKAEWQPGRLSYWNRAGKLRCECVKVWCKGSSWGGSVGEKGGDEAPFVNHGGDRGGEGTLSIPKDAGGNVWEGGCNQGGLVVF